MDPINPYQLPADAQGWRGLSLEGSSKRKWYTLLHNDQVLVTALLLIPGESSVRHAHESGELSIWYVDPMQPMVRWNPPGVFHAGPELPAEKAAAEEPPSMADPLLAPLLARMVGLEDEIKRLHERLDALTRPGPKPMVLVDVIFPPFKTIIDDPRYPKKTVVTGQWFD